MKTRKTISLLFGGLLSIALPTAALAQADPQDHDAHHPAEGQAVPVAPTEEATPPAGPEEDAPGMGMMTPEMMQMMQQMMGQGGMPGMMGESQGEAQAQGGPGMTTEMPMMGGMSMCPMMRMTAGGQTGSGMPGRPGGQALLLGLPLDSPQEMTEDRVRALLEQQLTILANPRLRLGELGTASDGSITAEIVTVDGSLVQKLAFNRYPGLVRQLD